MMRNPYWWTVNDTGSISMRLKFAFTPLCTARIAIQCVLGQ